MLSLELHNIGKKFRREWVFRSVNYNLAAGEKLVILGGNGSGKSTLLQILSGFLSPSEGQINFKLGHAELPAENVFSYIAYASPYIQLVDEFTLDEMIEHSSRFKPLSDSVSLENLSELIQLPKARQKYIKEFSSGMKQRLKLGLVILSNCPMLLLDEPLSNLDREGMLWYQTMIEKYCQNRTVVVCSNAVEQEYFFCSKQLNVMDYKS